MPERMQFEEGGSRVSTYGSLRTLLDSVRERKPRSVTVDIRSTGGSVADALLIYDTLKGCGAEVTTRCFGYAASAATIIAQAASPGRREISASCLYLVHDSSCETEGNRQEIESAADMLRQTDDRIAEIYAAASGRDKETFVRLMAANGGKGRWISP
ncbi:MAG: Clp protease ClpP [Alistipes sp.]|nr:Clp protease ClpP [Alistipes sp.]